MEEARRFVTTGDDPAYVLVAGNGPDRITLGVLVGVALSEAERAAELGTRARGHTDPVTVEVSKVIDPPPADAGQIIVGAETLALPVGSIMQPVPPPPDRSDHPPLLPPPPLLRTAGGWYSTHALAWDIEEDPVVPAAEVRFLVIFRALDGQP